MSRLDPVTLNVKMAVKDLDLINALIVCITSSSLKITPELAFLNVQEDSLVMRRNAVKNAGPSVSHA